MCSSSFRSNTRSRCEKYDVIILDPPAFTKSRNSVKNAVKGYREINRRAMQLLKDGGLPGHLFLFAFHDVRAVHADYPPGRGRRAPQAAPGGIPDPGSGSSHSVGGGRVVLSEVLYFPGVRGKIESRMAEPRRIEFQIIQFQIVERQRAASRESGVPDCPEGDRRAVKNNDGEGVFLWEKKDGADGCSC